jgi:hypothetical protein
MYSRQASNSQGDITFCVFVLSAGTFTVLAPSDSNCSSLTFTLPSVSKVTRKRKRKVMLKKPRRSKRRGIQKVIRKGKQKWIAIRRRHHLNEPKLLADQQN